MSPKLTSKISSSRRIINAGDVAARDASLASVSDNPAAPKAGIVLLRHFLFDARFKALPAFRLLTSVCPAAGAADVQSYFRLERGFRLSGQGGMVCPLSQSAARQIVPDEVPDRSNSGAGDKIAAF